MITCLQNNLSGHEDKAMDGKKAGISSFLVIELLTEAQTLAYLALREDFKVLENPD